MINTIFDKLGKTIVADNNAIIFQNIRQYSYGIPLSIRIGIQDYTKIVKFNIDNNYILLTDDGKTIPMILFERKSELVSGKILEVFNFIDVVFYKLLHNNIRYGIESIKFDRYINGTKNQLSFYIFELRKKALILTLNEDYKASEMSIYTAFSKDVKQFEDEPLSFKEIQDIENKRDNYYTINPDGMFSTNKGNGLAKFLPFATNLDISGLNNYILPKYELRGLISSYRLGDKITISDKPYIIIEKEIFIFKNNVKTFLVAGDYK